MRWNREQDSNDSMSDVNMTPLIDVSLVLVVILLLATPLAFESSFGVRKTSDSARKASNVEKEARIELAIESDSSVRVNRTAVMIDDLGKTLVPLLAESTSRDVTVTCGDEVAHGTFVHVLDVTKLSGAKEIAIAGS
ncbi:MAG: biopolymer transporter ExbD [Candidatus Krumholzibacteriota bacterium]